ncbi:MAG: laccase domain-containing protein [Alphaproteobacteria bacterium]|nr:laccase domain-containing protein [Alphaproteobacteria bacterium]
MSDGTRLPCPPQAPPRPLPGPRPTPLALRRSSLLATVPGLVHGFTTRDGPGELCGERGFDLGTHATAARWTAVAEALGMAGAAVARVRQVHGVDVVHAVGGGEAGTGDAVWTDAEGLLVAVRTADCVPVLVVDTDRRGRAVRVAAVHAGWRGLAADVIGAALATLDAAGATGGARLAAVGPCIGRTAYEVGPEVIEGIATADVPRALFATPGRGDRWHADLKAAAAFQLARAGAARTDVLPGCTLSDPALHSHRRDAEASGRLAGVIGLRPADAS